MATEALLLQQFRNGLINLRTNLSALPFIGPYLTARLQAQNIVTIQQLANRARNMSTAQLYDFLTDIVENRRKNRCARGYHIRDFNKNGYLTLRNLLSAVKQHWARYANALPVAPRTLVDRNRATAVCSCITDANLCRALEQQRVCQWRGIGRGAARVERCIPRRAGAAPAFEGQDSLAGQRAEQGAPPPGARFHSNWRVPDNVP